MRTVKRRLLSLAARVICFQNYDNTIDINYKNNASWKGSDFEAAGRNPGAGGKELQASVKSPSPLDLDAEVFDHSRGGYLTAGEAERLEHDLVSQIEFLVLEVEQETAV